MTTLVQPNSKLILKNQGGKISASTAEHIALVCSMNRRHKVALERRNKKALQRLASEYQALGCPRLAMMIRLEARGMTEKKVRP